MSVSVVIPWRPEPDRQRAFEWVRHHYEVLFADWELVCADAEGPWSRARSLNAGVENASGEVLVLADADCIAPAAELRALASTDDLSWGRPFDRLLRLRVEETEAVLASDPAHPELPNREPGNTGSGTGGVVVLRRELFGDGFHEDFEGWGAEDNWLAAQLRRQVGAGQHLPGVLTHLWHPRPAERRDSPAYRRNVELLAEAR